MAVEKSENIFDCILIHLGKVFHGDVTDVGSQQNVVELTNGVVCRQGLYAIHVNGGAGSKVGFYDKDLEQVTIRRVEKALGSAPALILGSAGVDEIFRSLQFSSPFRAGARPWGSSRGSTPSLRLTSGIWRCRA